jgi:amidase
MPPGGMCQDVRYYCFRLASLFGYLLLEQPHATPCSALSVHAAVSGATQNMAQWQTEFAGIPLNDAGMLMSLAGQLKFCQVADPLKTVRFEFPKSVLESYSYRMP